MTSTNQYAWVRLSQRMVAVLIQVSEAALDDPDHPVKYPDSYPLTKAIEKLKAVTSAASPSAPGTSSAPSPGSS